MKKFILCVFLILVLGFFSYFFKGRETSFDEEGLTGYFFYGESCPVCAQMSPFLDDLTEKYSEVHFKKTAVSDQSSVEELISFYQKYNVPKEKYGAVPVLFIEEEFFVGFSQKQAQAIENYVINLTDSTTTPEIVAENGETNQVDIPVLGKVDIKDYSLPALAVVLGFFDGFNVCSLGALVLILGLVLVLKERKKIFIFGGIFILTTALIYGLLIVLWYHLFVFLAPYLKMMETLVGLIGIIGGCYFLKEYLRFRKQGPSCEMGAGKGIISKFSERVQKGMARGVLAVLLSILLFAAVITIVEFPCSAAVPLFFAGVLAESNLSLAYYLSLIAVFILFYLIDEIIVFLIAVFTLTIKLASNKLTIVITLIESIVLFLLGLYYLFGFLIFH